MDSRERREKLENLAKLSEKQVEVMYYRVFDKTVAEIAEILREKYKGDNKNYDDSTIWSRFTRIFEILNIKGTEKEQQLIQDYSPIFLEFIKSEEDIKNWGHIRAEMLRQARSISASLENVPPTDEPEDSKPELPNSEVDKANQEIDPASTTGFPPGVGTPIDRETINHNRRFPRWYLIAIPLLVICLLCISGAVVGMSRIQAWLSTITASTQSPQSTQTSIATNTPGMQSSDTSDVIVSETSLPTSTITLTSIVLPPTATNTPTETSIPALFFDDFNNGKSDKWQLIYGSDPSIVNGALTFTDATLMIVDAKDWVNYEVSFYVSNMHCQEHVSSQGFTLGMRVQDANNMAALRLNDQDYCGGTWVNIENSQWNKLPNSDFKLPPVDSNGGRQLVVRIEGNKYSTPIGSSVVIDKYPSGGVAVIGNPGVTIDNFRVTSLP